MLFYIRVWILVSYTRTLRSEGVTVGQKGRRTLVTASLQREDGLDKVLETIDPLRIHSFCRKKLYS